MSVKAGWARGLCPASSLSIIFFFVCNSCVQLQWNPLCMVGDRAIRLV